MQSADQALFMNVLQLCFQIQALWCTACDAQIGLPC